MLELNIPTSCPFSKDSSTQKVKRVYHNSQAEIRTDIAGEFLTRNLLEILSTRKSDLCFYQNVNNLNESMIMRGKLVLMLVLKPHHLGSCQRN